MTKTCVEPLEWHFEEASTPGQWNDVLLCTHCGFVQTIYPSGLWITEDYAVAEHKHESGQPGVSL